MDTGESPEKSRRSKSKSDAKDEDDDVIDMQDTVNGTSTSSSGGGRGKRGGRQKIEGVTLDLRQHASEYKGITKIRRLIFIAERVPSLSKKAYGYAVDAAQHGLNVDIYNEVTAAAQEAHGSDAFPIDTQWCSNVTRQVQSRMQRLEDQLAVQKQNQDRSGIREAYMKLAELFVARGDYAAAVSKYVEARDFADSPQHQIDTSMALIKTSVFLRTMVHVKTEANRALGIDKDGVLTPVVVGRLKASLALYHLRNKNWPVAARYFQEIPYEAAGKFPEVISSRDIAIYGGLLSLATGTRRDLKSKVLDNEHFKSFLESHPQMRDIIDDFYMTEYAKCMKSLDRLKPNLLVDMFISGSVDALYKKIRAKALSQYFSPFISVDMHKMADSFQVSIADLEKEIGALILSNDIQGRIDSYKKVLHAKDFDQRAATFRKSLHNGRQYVRDMKSMLLRMSLIKHNVVNRSSENNDGYDDEALGHMSDDDEFIALTSSSSRGLRARK